MFTLEQKHADRLIVLLKKIGGFFGYMHRIVLRLSESDTKWFLIIISLSVFTRLLFIGAVDHAEFDEVYLAFFVTHIMNGIPFFDIHPPLVRILFTEVVRYTPFHIFTFKVLGQQPFADFPFITLRYLVAVFGTLLPLIIYQIGRSLSYTPRMAGLAALFVVFDNALTLYSRVMLPDTILLVFEFLALLSALAAVRSSRRWPIIVFTTLAGIFSGCALSTKWLALGVIAVVCLVLLLRRRFLSIISVISLSLLVYVGVFFIYFSYFPNGGTLDVDAFPVIPALQSLSFPADHSLSSLFRTFVAMHSAMFAANRDPYVTATIMQAPDVYTWAIAKSNIYFWVGEGGKMIVLGGNSLLYVATTFLFLFELGWILVGLIRTKRLPIDRNEFILLVGYIGNYLPFFFIHRSMYLYHYFPALIFLFLLAPRIIPRVIDCLAKLSRDRLFALTFAWAAFILIIVNFFLSAPTTYGY